MTEPLSPRDRIAAGYTENEGRPTRQDHRLGATHRPNEQMDEYAALFEADREKFDRLPRQTRMAVGHYMEARAAAERTGQV